MKKILLIIILGLTLAGCSNLETPIGIGHGRDALKKSPCACNTFYDFKKGGFLK